MDTCTYTHSVSYKEKEQVIEKKRQITAREYMKLLENVDKSMKILTKKRQCFLYNKTYMILDTYTNVDGLPALLRILNEKDAKEVDIPKIFVVVRDVTDEAEYSNYAMARNDWKMPDADRKRTEEQENEELAGKMRKGDEKKTEDDDKAVGKTKKEK